MPRSALRCWLCCNPKTVVSVYPSAPSRYRPSLSFDSRVRRVKGVRLFHHRFTPPLVFFLSSALALLFLSLLSFLPLQDRMAEQKGVLEKSERDLRFAMPRNVASGLDAVERLVKEQVRLGWGRFDSIRLELVGFYTCREFAQDTGWLWEAGLEPPCLSFSFFVGACRD